MAEKKSSELEYIQPWQPTAVSLCRRCGLMIQEDHEKACLNKPALVLIPKADQQAPGVTEDAMTEKTTEKKATGGTAVPEQPIPISDEDVTPIEATDVVRRRVRSASSAASRLPTGDRSATVAKTVMWICLSAAGLLLAVNLGVDISRKFTESGIKPEMRRQLEAQSATAVSTPDPLVAPAPVSTEVSVPAAPMSPQPSVPPTVKPTEPNKVQQTSPRERRRREPMLDPIPAPTPTMVPAPREELAGQNLIPAAHAAESDIPEMLEGDALADMRRMLAEADGQALRYFQGYDMDLFQNNPDVPRICNAYSRELALRVYRKHAQSVMRMPLDERSTEAGRAAVIGSNVVRLLGKDCGAELPADSVQATRVQREVQSLQRLAMSP